MEGREENEQRCLQHTLGAEEVDRTAVPEARNIMETYSKFYGKEIWAYEIPREQLFAVAKICCKDEDRGRYITVMREMKENVTNEMAVDVYELFVAMDLNKMDSSIIDEWFKEIEIQFSNREWKSGKLIPMSLMIWRNQATEDALEVDNEFLDRDGGETGEESWMFLPRDRLRAHLTTYLSRHGNLSMVRRKLLSKYPMHIRYFLWDSKCLELVSDRDILFELLKLASEFEIEDLYFRAYARIIFLELPLEYIPPLHLHEFSAEEVLEQKESDQSPFTTLIAEDASSAKVLNKVLLEISGYFEAYLRFYSDEKLPKVRSICKDFKVLDTWMQFLHIPKLNCDTEVETLVDLIVVVDYYDIKDEMLFEVLSMLNDKLSYTNAKLVYEHLPILYEDRKDDTFLELIHSMEKRMEKEFLDVKYIRESQQPVQLLALFGPAPTSRWSDSTAPQSIFFLNKCSRELKGADKLCEVIAPSGILLYQVISKSRTISDCKFFSFNLDYTFDQISLNSSFYVNPRRFRMYLHQRKLFILEIVEHHHSILDLDTGDRKLLPNVSSKCPGGASYVFYLGTVYAIASKDEEDPEITIYKYDIDGHCWINMENFIYKCVESLPTRFRDEFLVFGDLLVAIYKDEWVAYLRPSPTVKFELELNYFTTFYPENTFKDVVGMHKKNRTKKKSDQYWYVFKMRSLLILNAEDLKLRAEVPLPLINNRPWWKAISSGEERVYLVLNWDANTYLDVYEVTIELNESDFEQTKVEIKRIIESRPISPSQKLSPYRRNHMGVVERIVIV